CFLPDRRFPPHRLPPGGGTRPSTDPRRPWHCVSRRRRWWIQRARGSPTAASCPKTPCLASALTPLHAVAPPSSDQRTHLEGVLLLTSSNPLPRSRIRHRLSWTIWAVLTFTAIFGLTHKMTSKETSKEMFLPGATTHGHYQIELECAVCHTESFTTKSEFQGACLKCHGDELNTAEDSHPPSKFESPRNAERTKALDARHCITCHAQHHPGRTGTMGLSIPQDYCCHCHQDIGKERASHQGLAFDSCANAGCHNFHDNRALYEDYLLRHASEPSIRPSAQ